MNVITYLLNNCLKDKKFPNDFKIAVVTHLFKNKGDLKDVHNY